MVVVFMNKCPIEDDKYNYCDSLQAHRIEEILWAIACHVNNLLIISTVDDSLSVPATLLALHVYSALSSTAAFSITRVLPLLIENFPPVVTCFPSFSQVTSGVGTPLTGHLMVMVVLETAVTLSPTFIVTGLPSLTGIFCPGIGTSMTGFMGSANDSLEHLDKVSRLKLSHFVFVNMTSLQQLTCTTTLRNKMVQLEIDIKVQCDVTRQR